MAARLARSNRIATFPKYSHRRPLSAQGMPDGLRCIVRGRQLPKRRVKRGELETCKFFINFVQVLSASSLSLVQMLRRRPMLTPAPFDFRCSKQAGLSGAPAGEER